MIVQNVFPILLLVYDQLLLIRSHILSNIVVQFLIALFFIGSMFVAIVLFVYWGSCAVHVLAANDLLLTDAEVEPMLWEKKLRALLLGMFNWSLLAMS